MPLTTRLAISYLYLCCTPYIDREKVDQPTNQQRTSRVPLFILTPSSTSTVHLMPHNISNNNFALHRVCPRQSLLPIMEVVEFFWTSKKSAPALVMSLHSSHSLIHRKLQNREQRGGYEIFLIVACLIRSHSIDNKNARTKVPGNGKGEIETDGPFFQQFICKWICGSFACRGWHRFLSIKWGACLGRTLLKLFSASLTRCLSTRKRRPVTPFCGIPTRVRVKIRIFLD